METASLDGLSDRFPLVSARIVFSGPGQVTVREERVEAPAPGQVVIRTSYSLVSTGTELTCLAGEFSPGGHWDEWVRYPFQPGYSNVGRVAATGAGVAGLREGDRVASHTPHAQFTAVPAEEAIRIPDSVTDEDASWFAIASIAQIGVRRARLAAGSCAVVLGAGILGQLTAQFARRAGAGRVIVVARSAARLDRAIRAGATDAVAASADQAVARIRDLTGGTLADAVFDVTGDPAVLPSALVMARRFGRVVLVGDPGFPERQHLTADVLLRGVELVGAHFGYASRTEPGEKHPSHHELSANFFSGVEKGEIDVAGLVTHRYSPRDCAEAYATLLRRDGSTLGLVFDWARV